MGRTPARSRFVSTDVPPRAWVVRVFHVGTSAPLDARRRRLARRVVDDAAPLTTSELTTDHPLDFDAFYRAQYPSVVRLAYSLCGSMSIAEELAQEAFVSAHKRWRKIGEFDRPDLWVRRVVINRSISYRRREASERRAVERIRLVRDRATEPVVSDETIWQAMRELSPRQAEVLALFYVEDQPLATVAEILGLGPETVKTHLKRGRAALAAKLSEHELAGRAEDAR